MLPKKTSKQLQKHEDKTVTGYNKDTPVKMQKRTMKRQQEATRPQLLSLASASLPMGVCGETGCVSVRACSSSSSSDRSSG